MVIRRGRGGCASEMQACGGEALVGFGDGEADERGHHVALAGGRWQIVGDEQGDTRAIEAGGVGRRRLGEYDSRRSWRGQVDDGTDIELEMAKQGFGRMLGLRGDIGDGHLLGSERLGDADLTSAADA